MMLKPFMYAALACILLLIGRVQADDYIGKDIPSDEILLRNLKAKTQWEIIKTLGKYKDREDSYHIYYLIKTPQMPFAPQTSIQQLSSISLTRLDTNIWIITVPDYSPWVLQK